MLKRFCVLSAVMAATILTSRSNADSVGMLTATLNGAGPTNGQTTADTVYINYSPSGYAGLDVYSGFLQWKSTSSSGASNPIANNTPFATYCIDILSEISLGNPYSFEVNTNLGSAAAFSGPYAYVSSATKLQAVENLWNDFYTSTLGTSSSDILAEAAFQLDIWQILYGTAFSYSGSMAMDDLASSQLTTVDTQLSAGKYATVNGLYALISTDGGQDQALYQQTGNSGEQPESTPLPRASFAGFALLGGFGLYSLRVELVSQPPKRLPFPFRNDPMPVFRDARCQ